MTEMCDCKADFAIEQQVIDNAAASLGPQHFGVALFRGVIGEDILKLAMAETNDPDKVQWRSHRQTHKNKRGAMIEENYYTYALKLHHGDREIVDRLPTLLALTCAVENLVVRDLSQHFPNLQNWQADETKVHRYDAGRVGISHHLDQTRFWGIIAVATLDGAGEFGVVSKGSTEQKIQLDAGDLLLMRGPGLYDAPNAEDIRPMHGVDNRDSSGRMSLLVRANRFPDEQRPGFVYDNWAPATISRSAPEILNSRPLQRKQ